MQLLTPLQRLAIRLHIAVEDAATLPDLEIAIRFNAGLAIASGGAAAVAGLPLIAACGTVVLVFLGLTFALYRPTARWMSIALGSATAMGIGLAIGGLSDKSGYVIAGIAAGMTCAAVGYGPLVMATLRRGR